MSKPKPKKNDTPEVETQSTPEGRVYNFTRHGFVVVAKTLSEAHKALKEFLNQPEETEESEEESKSKEIEE